MEWHVRRVPSKIIWKFGKKPQERQQNFKKCHFQIGNCDIDFFNFRHRQVWNFKILNLFEQNLNFAVIFRKYQKFQIIDIKQNRMLNDNQTVQVKKSDAILADNLRQPIHLASKIGGSETPPV